MSLMQTCAEAEVVITRARSLFGTAAAVDVPSGSAEITTASQGVTTARSRTTDLSGTGVTSYQAMADRSVPPLTTAASSDSALAAHMTTAAAVTQAGAARLDGIAAQTKLVTQMAPMARSSGDQCVILTALRSQVAAASQVVQSTQQQAGALAAQVRGLEYPKESPGGAQPLDVPLAPQGDSPPHGKDPRYWVDVTKIIHVPEGQLAPANTTQIGPGLWYPYSDSQLTVSPPPPPAKYPLDMSDIVHVEPGQVGPYGTMQLAPGIFAPTPSTLNPESPWSTPQQPIDIRDIIQVPKGTLAPWGYREYLPGWWVPDPSASGPH